MEATKVNGTTMGQVEVRVLRSLPELEEIRSFWESWPGNRDSDIDFYGTVLRASLEAVRPHVIVVLRDRKPDAILVGRIDSTRLNFRVGYFRVKPKARLLYFVYGALRGNASRENCEIMVHEVCQALSKKEADLAYLNFHRPDSSIFRLSKSVPGVMLRDHTPLTQLHYTRRLARSIKEFHGELSPKLRRNQRWKKLVNDFQGTLRIRCFRETAELEELVRDAEVIAKSSYQRGLGVGFHDNAEERERLQLKAQKGWLRGYVLYLADRPCAFWIGDINGGVFGSDYLAFDPFFGKYSPGTYLIFKVLEGFCADRAEAISGVDFATGHAEYKEAFSTDHWEEKALYICAPSIKGVGLNLVRTLTGGIDKALKAGLEQTGLLPRIKRVWRARLRSAQ